MYTVYEKQWRMGKSKSQKLAKKRLIKIFKEARLGIYQTSIFSFKEIVAIWVNYNSNKHTGMKIILVHETSESTVFYIK